MDLFSLYSFNEIELRNQMVMAPMTRCRAIAGNVITPLSVLYYAQRARAGMII